MTWAEYRKLPDFNGKIRELHISSLYGNLPCEGTARVGKKGAEMYRFSLYTVGIGGEAIYTAYEKETPVFRFSLASPYTWAADIPVHPDPVMNEGEDKPEVDIPPLESDPRKVRDALLSSFTADELEKELERRKSIAEKQRLEDEKNRERWILENVDHLIKDTPHEYVSCSDDNPCNSGFPHGWTSPRCTRCCLISARRKGEFPFILRVEVKAEPA